MPDIYAPPAAPYDDPGFSPAPLYPPRRRLIPLLPSATAEPLPLSPLPSPASLGGLRLTPPPAVGSAAWPAAERERLTPDVVPTVEQSVEPPAGVRSRGRLVTVTDPSLRPVPPQIAGPAGTLGLSRFAALPSAAPGQPGAISRAGTTTDPLREDRQLPEPDQPSSSFNTGQQTNRRNIGKHRRRLISPPAQPQQRADRKLLESPPRSQSASSRSHRRPLLPPTSSILRDDLDENGQPLPSSQGQLNPNATIEDRASTRPSISTGAKLASLGARLGSNISNSSPLSASAPINISLYVAPGRLPDDNQISDALFAAYGPDHLAWAKKYRAVMGQNPGQLLVDKAALFKYGTYYPDNPQNPGAGGRLSAPIIPQQSSIRRYNAFVKSGGDARAVNEVQARIEQEEGRDRAAIDNRNTYLDTLRRTGADILQSTGSYVNNAENLGSLIYHTYSGRKFDPEWMKEFNRNEAASREMIAEARAAVPPQEKTAVQGMLRTFGGAIGDLPQYMMTAPFGPGGMIFTQAVKDADKPLDEAMTNIIGSYVFAGTGAIGHGITQRVQGQLAKRAVQFTAGGSGMAAQNVMRGDFDPRNLAKSFVLGGALTQLHGREEGKEEGDIRYKRGTELRSPIVSTEVGGQRRYQGVVKNGSVVQLVELPAGHPFVKNYKRAGLEPVGATPEQFDAALNTSQISAGGTRVVAPARQQVTEPAVQPREAQPDIRLHGRRNAIPTEVAPVAPGKIQGRRLIDLESAKNREPLTVLENRKRGEPQPIPVRDPTFATRSDYLNQQNIPPASAATGNATPSVTRPTLLDLRKRDASSNAILTPPSDTSEALNAAKQDQPVLGQAPLSVTETNYGKGTPDAVSNGRIEKEAPEALDVLRSSDQVVNREKPLREIKGTNVNDGPFKTSLDEAEYKLSRQLERLSKASYRDLIEGLDYRLDGHYLKVNPKTGELLRRCYQQMFKEEGRFNPFKGTFNNFSRVEGLTIVLQRIGEKHPEHRKELAALSRAINKAADMDDTMILSTFDPSLIHEEFHRASYHGSPFGLLENKHADFEALANSPELQKARPHLLNNGYKDVGGRLVEELAAHIWQGHHENFGLTDEEAINYLQKWFISYTKKNGRVTLKQFRQGYREAVKAIENEEHRQEAVKRAWIGHEALRRAITLSRRGRHTQGPTQQGGRGSPPIP